MNRDRLIEAMMWYRKNLWTLRKTYGEEYIAIDGNQVVDHHIYPKTLLNRLKTDCFIQYIDGMNER